MAGDDKPRRGGAGGTARPGVNASERPFDLWLHKQLHAMYDEIASEPLPTDLLKLIDSDAAKTAGARSDDGSGSEPSRTKKK